MNILVDINHPAHVHMFRNAIIELQKKKHNITIIARKKEVTTQLLDLYKLPYVCLSKAQKGLFGLALELIIKQSKLLPILLKNKIELVVSMTGASSIHVSRLLGIPYLMFTDSEQNTLQNNITIPFVSRVYTPEKYYLDYGKKHMRYAGYHELAYLHPNRFTPDPSIFEKLGLKNNDHYFILRFVSWNANHDVGEFGFSLEEKRQIIEYLKPYGKIFITSEKDLEPEFKEYAITLPPDQLHNLLYYATMVIADSQTVTTESAVLGTPAIRYNSYVGPKDCSNFTELENDYGLLYCFNKFEKAFDKIKELVQTENLKQTWEEKRKKLLNHKIDVTQFMIETIESYNKN